MTRANRIAILTATTALAFGQVAVGAAQDVFVIDEAVTDTNGANPVNGGDTLIVTENGSIDVSTSSPGVSAVSGSGNDITVENAGRLTTSDGGEGAVIFGDDGSIDNSGTIVANGNGGSGQYIVGDDAWIGNSGTIMTTGNLDTVSFNGAEGQAISGVNGRIENSGSITTAGNGAYGQYIFDDLGSIENSGIIDTGGLNGHGQYIFVGSNTGDSSSLVNFGSISTDGPAAFGQFVRGDNATITNQDSIATTGDDSYGQYIFEGDNGRIENSGSITTLGTNAHGQYIGNDTSNPTTADFGHMVNSGTIMLEGPDAYAQYLLGNEGSITNSGWLVSATSAAIVVEGVDNTINLLAPGFIGGPIDFEDADNTTINVTTGPSHSILWTLTGDDIADGAPNISGSVPWFYNAADQSVATFDPTLLSTQTDALGDLTSLLSRLGLGALDDLDAVGGGPLAYGPESDAAFVGGIYAADPVMLDQAVALESVSLPMTRRGWAAVFGGQMDHDGTDTTLDSDIDHLGLAAGYTWQQTPGLTLNAMAGYVRGDWSADAVWAPSFDHDTHTVFAGLHGEQELDWGAVQFGLTAGYQWVDHNRFVNDNLAPLGESWVSADYGGFFISPEVAVSTDIAMDHGITLTPSAGLRYAAIWLGGYTETGAVNPAANARVDAHMVGVIEARAELEASRTFDWGSVSARAGYLGRRGHGSDVGIALNGSAQDITIANAALNAATVGGTIRANLGASSYLELDASYLHGDTAQGFGGRLSLGVRF